MPFDEGPASCDAQESDVGRAVSMNMEHLDFVVEETWRWALSCAFTHSVMQSRLPTQLYIQFTVTFTSNACKYFHGIKSRIITYWASAHSLLVFKLPLRGSPMRLTQLWVSAVFIGLSMGTFAFLVDVGLETLNNWKFDATREAIKARP